MNTNTDQKKTRTPSPRKVEKRAPSRPAAGYTCAACKTTGLGPDEMSSATRCFDC